MPESEDKRFAQTVPARRAQLTNAAVRATDNPVQLAKAARIIRAALQRGKLTPDDLQGDVVRAWEVGGNDAA